MHFTLNVVYNKKYMRKIIGLIVFVIVQTLFIPFAIIGFLIVFYKQMYVSKKLEVSSTAVEIINGRWMMDKFGIRKDPATVQLFKVMPNTSSLGLWLALYPLYLLRQITGENIFYLELPLPVENSYGPQYGQIMVDPDNPSWLVYNRDENGDAGPQGHSEQAADQRQQHGFRKELDNDVRFASPQRPADTDLPRALTDRCQHDIHNADPANQQGNRGDRT